jgi:hypothetical protein
VDIKEKCKSLIRVWIQQENGDGVYKLTGGYWEVLLPILEKYAPNELAEYGQLLGENFDIRNQQVKTLLDMGLEETNYKNALEFMNERIDMFATPQDPHYIDLGDDNIIAYIPNQAVQEQPEPDND